MQTSAARLTLRGQERARFATAMPRWPMACVCAHTMNFPALVSLVLVSLSACAGKSPPPASVASPSAGAETDHPGVAGSQDATATRADLRDELAALDASLGDLSKLVAQTTSAVKADLEQQLAALQNRRDVVAAQIQTLADEADAQGVKARREARAALKGLQRDLQHLTDRLNPKP